MLACIFVEGRAVLLDYYLILRNVKNLLHYGVHELKEGKPPPISLVPADVSMRVGERERKKESKAMPANMLIYRV